MFAGIWLIITFDNYSSLFIVFIGLMIFISGIYVLFKKPKLSVTVVDGVRGTRITNVEIENDNKGHRREGGFRSSLVCPKYLSKRYESTFLLHLYLPEHRSKILRNIKLEFDNQEIIEHTQASYALIEQKIRVKLFSPQMSFSDPVTKTLNNAICKMIFLAKPNDDCRPGTHKVLVSVVNYETDQEIDSFSISVQVVDFAFDHISRPLLSKISSVVLGIGSFAMFVLSFLEQIDKAIGLTSGTAAGVMAVIIYTNFYSLYQRIRPNTP